MDRTKLLCASLLLLSTHATAVALAPCSTALLFPAITIIPVSNGMATYCVSDHGWSDTWFVGSMPLAYDATRDVLSGDDAPNLRFGIRGGTDPWATSGFGWISPIMDGGDLAPTHLTTSPIWTVVTPVHYTSVATRAESLVRNALGMDLAITTELAPTGQQVTMRFVLTNTTDDTTFDRIRFADYFNFHPNGSLAGNASRGSVSYTPLGGIRITGPRDSTFIADGSMRGERVDDAHGISLPSQTIPLPVLDMVQTDTYPDPLLIPIGVPSGPGDVAGGLAWNLGELGPGESVAFTIFKLAEPLGGAVPEPTMPALLGIGMLGLRLARGRAGKRTSEA